MSIIGELAEFEPNLCAENMTLIVFGCKKECEDFAELMFLASVFVAGDEKSHITKRLLEMDINVIFQSKIN